MMQKIPVRQLKITESRACFEDIFTILDLNELLNGDALYQAVHRHDFFFVLILEIGKGEHTIDFSVFPVENNSIFILRPGQVHSLCLEKVCKGYLVRFNSNAIPNANQLLKKISKANLYQFSHTDFLAIKAVFSKIHEEFLQQKDAYQEVIKAYMEVFFILVWREKKTVSLTKTNSYQQEYLDQLIELIETHVTQFKNVSAYAKMLNLSIYQLNNITKKVVGKTCSKLIVEQIILEAKRQLLATTNQVNQIALSLGYEDPSYFIRFFKKHTDYSPENFRKNFT